MFDVWWNDLVAMQAWNLDISHMEGIIKGLNCQMHNPMTKGDLEAAYSFSLEMWREESEEIRNKLVIMDIEALSLIDSLSKVDGHSSAAYDFLDKGKALSGRQSRSNAELAHDYGEFMARNWVNEFGSIRISR